MKKILKTLFFTALLFITACSQKDKAHISGVVTGGEGDTIIVKCLQDNKLVTLDYKVLKNDGKFKFALEKGFYPEYYFVQVANGQQLVLIHDSCNHINISADAKSLASAKIEGSKVSEQIQETALKVSELRAHFRKYLKEYDSLDEESKKVSSDNFYAEIIEVKDFIGKEIYKSSRSYYSYYALFQRLDDGSLLFSPYNDDDYKYFAAAATAYNVFQKEDPRTKILYDLVSDALKKQRAAALQKMIDEAPFGIPEIIMNDNKGVEQKLSDYKGKIVILNFWASANEESRQFNKKLLALYNKYRNRGVVVYQVSADKSRLLWQEAIEQDKLPWINVCDFKAGASQALMLYNVQKLPTTYLIDRKGELNSNVNSISALENAIKDLL